MKAEEMIGQAMQLPLSTISYGPLVTSWCCWEYPNHPNGCQNFYDKEWCPPKVEEFPAGVDVSNYNLTRGHNDEMFLLRLKPGLEPTMWLFIRHFNLKGWVKGLRKEHPQMSDNQARIPYLYNDKVYSQIYADAEAYRWGVSRPTILLRRPEANGVNLFATCRVNGGPQLERNPRNDVYFMAILGEHAS
ncbi:hypothetical protein LCGC14_0658100 [marine sediment metagenome]|uniref:Uncharacterized protein n=1 Tax=marine sediment metagenome TaxID=412755 RepID=A0A0F9TG27_9ZZZZ